MTGNLLRKLTTGLRHPHQVPPYVVGRAAWYLGWDFLESRFGPGYRRQDGFITFSEGEFAGGNPAPPEHTARIFRETAQIDRLLGDATFARSLEIGCGYGRLSGWIADHAEEAAAIEPNEDVLETASRLYVDIDFRRALAEDIPFPDDHFDLVVAWSVLSHIPPGPFERSASEIKRVVTDDGTILLCEKTSGDAGDAVWVRSTEQYASVFAPFHLVATEPRAAEPSFTYAGTQEVLQFVGAPDAERSPPLRSKRT